MGAPIIAVDDYGNRRMYPLHTVVADEQAVGYEVDRIYSGRRDELNYWTSITANAQRIITWTYDRVRALDYFFLDRFHNLAGITLTYAVSQDNFTTSETVFSVAPPTVTARGNPADTYGVRTGEGAWLKTFPMRPAKYARLTIPAMGAGLRPRIGGLSHGPMLTLGAFTKPYDPDHSLLVVEESTSDTGALGRGRTGRQRRGVITYRFGDLLEYEEAARLHLHGHFGDGRPTWILHDADEGQRAVRAIREMSGLGFPIPTGRATNETQLAWVEYEPKAA